MVKINIDLNNKVLIFLAFLVVVFVVIGLSNAFGGVDPTIHGHSNGEIQMALNLECVTGYRREIQNADDEFYIYDSSLGNSYSFDSVFDTGVDMVGIHGGPWLECKNGWVLTGCTSSRADADGNEQWLGGKNRCTGEYGGYAQVSARCCKIITS